MPYKDKHLQNEYQKRYRKERRLTWIKSQGGTCKKCGSDDRLEVDHVNPELKITHHVWGWSEKRRTAELSKCQVLCYSCHKEKTIEQRKHAVHGTNSMYTLGCKCTICKAAHARVELKWRKERAVSVNG